MTNRVYLPSDYADEICPPLRPSPSDWIVKHGDLYHLVENSAFRRDDRCDKPGTLLVTDAIVAFDWREDHPSRTVTVHLGKDGTVEFSPIGFVPASINMFWVDDDFDTMIDTLDGCLKNLKEDGYLEDGQEIDIDMAEWGHASFRFVSDVKGVRFVAVDEKPREDPAQAVLPGLSG